MTAEFAAGVLEHAADAQLAALLRISANLAEYAEQRAHEIAAPVIAEAQRTAAAASEELEEACAPFDQRVADLRPEWDRCDRARDRIVGQLGAELERARGAPDTATRENCAD